MSKRALIIRSDYDSLPGVHNSAECIAQLLHARGFEIVPCEGPAATRSGILGAYDELITQAKPDDAIVIYYTGHGGLATNSTYVVNSDLPRYLQHICPSDFAETTDDDFRGISMFELSLQLAALTRKTANATVILDCCFAAQMSRGEQAGAAPVTPPKLTRVGLTAHLAALRERCNDFEAVALAGNPDAVRVAASGQTELARRVELPSGDALRALGVESSRHDGWIGAMTLGLSQILAEIGDARVAWRSIAPELRARLLVQRPEIEGPIARVPFSLATVAAATFALRRDGDAAIVEAGRLLGVSVGDVYGVMPAGSQGIDPARLIATLAIDEVSAMQAHAHRIDWRNGHRDLPATAAAVAMSLALERYPVRVVAPDPAPAVIEAALQASGRVRAATAADREVLAELHVRGTALELRDALGPLFPASPYPARLGDAVMDLANLATERRLKALPDDGGIAPTDVVVELGVVAPSHGFRPIAGHGEPLGLGDLIDLRLTNTTDTTLYANVFNIGLQRRIGLLSARAASGIALPPHTQVHVGEAIDGKLRGFRLSWPRGLPADRPRIDTLMVMITAGEADLRVLESRSHSGQSKSVSTALQQLLAQLATGQARRGTGASGLQPAPFAIHWRDYRLFPIDASLDLGAAEVEASPPGTAASDTTGAAALRVRFEALERTPATTRVDVLACARSTASPFRATTVFPDRPGNPVVWSGNLSGPLDLYVWTSTDRGDRRPLAELLALRPLSDAIAALRAPAGDPRLELTAGASLQLAAAARTALARALPDVATAFRGSFGPGDLGARRYTTAAAAFTLGIESTARGVQGRQRGSRTVRPGQGEDVMAEPTFHALLIGADGYFPNKLSNGGRYLSLGGCVNDALRIQAMLEQRLEDHQIELTTLLAPADDQGDPTGDQASWPTAANIRSALAELADRAQPGDQVYIHYSGHGGRISTAWKHLKGEDGVDEALVPIDIGLPDLPGGRTSTRPERYIRDVELALYLDHLTSKVDAANRRITVTLVFDSCHSGGATRGLGDLAKRSASGGGSSPGDPAGTLDRRESLADRAYTDEQAASMAAALERLRSSTSPSTAPAATTWLPPAKGYVLLAASRDVEAALECAVDGRPRGGVLTDALIEALNALGTDQSWKTVYDRVLARVHSLVGSQTPQLLGDINRHIFGVDLKPIEHTLQVAAVDRASRTVTLNGGLALTVTQGTELAIYAPGATDFSLADRRVATATVVEANALDSQATLDAAADPSAIEIGAPAVIRALSLRRRVELLARSDLPPQLGARQDAVLAAISAAIQREGRGFLEVCLAGVTPHYQVALSPQGHVEICDPRGEPFHSLEPVIGIDDPRAASSVIAQLLRLGRYHTVLEMSEPESELRDQLRIELLAAPPGWSARQPTASAGGSPLPRTGDAYSVPAKTWLWLRLTNQQPSTPLNVALLDLTRTWEIEMIVPNSMDLVGKKYETVADRPRTFAFRMSTPVPETIDVLKLFITVADVDFRALATTAQTMRSAGRGGANALGRLVDAITAPQRRTRDVEPQRSTSAPWTVQEFRMRTFQ